MSKIKVLVVDDSAMVRKLITTILDADPRIEVVGSAADPIIARRKIKQLIPDVLTLDVEMPNMDGITFLRHLMRLHPMPVVMVSTLTEKGADTTLEALEIGAVGYVTKPKVDLAVQHGEMEAEIVKEVKLAAKSKVRARDETEAPESGAAARHLSSPTRPMHSLVAIGASTGGVAAIKEILLRLPAESPPIVVTQHIAEDFSARFAMRLDKQVALTVCEARAGMVIERGHVYIAPGSHHLEVRRSSGAGLSCHLKGGEKVSRHRPSVDVLFQSVAANVGSSAMGVLLTGMGEDGASGLSAMKSAGCYTIAQDRATSVVWSMPETAVKLDAVMDVLPLASIPERLLSPLKN